jgi:hypothetical protein
MQEGIGEGYRKEFHRGAGDSLVLGEDRFIYRVLKTESQMGKPPSV